MNTTKQTIAHPSPRFRNNPSSGSAKGGTQHNVKNMRNTVLSLTSTKFQLRVIPLTYGQREGPEPPTKRLLRFLCTSLPLAQQFRRSERRTNPLGKEFLEQRHATNLNDICSICC